MDLILSAQTMVTEVHDEHLFIVTHQVTKSVIDDENFSQILANCVSFSDGRLDYSQSSCISQEKTTIIIFLNILHVPNHGMVGLRIVVQANHFRVGLHMPSFLRSSLGGGKNAQIGFEVNREIAEHKVCFLVRPSVRPSGIHPSIYPSI